MDALKGDDGQMIIDMWRSDGFVSATKMCQSAGKMWSNDDSVAGHEEIHECSSFWFCFTTLDVLVDRCDEYAQRCYFFGHPGEWLSCLERRDARSIDTHF